MKKYKYIKPCCPICNDNKDVISDYLTNGSSSCSLNLADKFIIAEGQHHFYYYCSNCFVDFNIKETYVRYKKDKMIGITGNTGFR